MVIPINKIIFTSKSLHDNKLYFERIDFFLVKTTLEDCDVCIVRDFVYFYEEYIVIQFFTNFLSYITSKECRKMHPFQFFNPITHK